MAKGRKKKLWRYSYGQAPDTVQIREKYLGSNLYLRSGVDVDVPLGFKVRDEDGELDPDAEKEARRVAEARNLDLRLARQKGATEPSRLTVGQAFAEFKGRKGVMPKSKSAYRNYERAMERWEAHLGRDTPWNRVVKADVRELLASLRDEAGVPNEAWHALKLLRRVTRWLDEDAGYEGLRNPTKGIPLKEARGEDYRPRKPRYSAEEARKLIETRHHPDLDPRWALFLALMDDSGRRGVSIRRLKRSDLGYVPQDMAPPPPEVAPYGWLWFRGTKGQKGAPVPLTEFQRGEMDLALVTWLRDLEEAYEAGRIQDYQLIPGEYFPDSGVFRVDQAGVHKPLAYNTSKNWIHRAEEKAGIPHVAGRALHGIRRHWVDLTRTGLGIEGAQFAGDWSSRETVESYAEEMKYDVRDAARRLHEQKRRTPNEDD